MDYAASKFPTYKLETDGNGTYIIASGLFDDETDEDHAIHIAKFAILVNSIVTMILNPITMQPLKVKIGIHSSEMYSGLIGSKYPRLKLYGSIIDEVKLLAKHGETNKIHCSEATFNSLKPTNLFELSNLQYMKMKNDCMKLKWNTSFINGSNSLVHDIADIKEFAKQTLINIETDFRQEV